MNDRFTGWRKSSYSQSSGNCVEVGRAVTWRKSSYSDSSGNCVQVAAPWRKSSYSGNSANCIEVAVKDITIGVRDSKLHGRGPVLEFSSAAWKAFVTAAKTGEYDI
jgi:Domain of unknown function (DUF397)